MFPYISSTALESSSSSYRVAVFPDPRRASQELVVAVHVEEGHCAHLPSGTWIASKYSRASICNYTFFGRSVEKATGTRGRATKIQSVVLFYFAPGAVFHR
jgi:hypothetical protein